MHRFLLVLFGVLTATQWVDAAEICKEHDKDFSTFLDRFKNDKSFQESRILFPLEMTSTEPDSGGTMTTTHWRLSQKQKQEQSVLIIRGRVEAENLGDGEGKLCEEGPVVKERTATLLQYSCHTDVYGYNYRFVLKNGCWYLVELATSGR